jgi:hypothetical protein
MPSWFEIVNKPHDAMVPTNGAAICLVISKLLTNAKAEVFDSIMTYTGRLPREAQALVAIGMMQSNNPHRSVAVTNKMFTEWAIKNGWMF